MAHRSFARILAPLALVGALVAIVLVVQTSTSGSGGSTVTPTQSSGESRGDGRTTEAASETSADGQPERRRRTYTVKPGDILSTVSEETDLTVDELQALNPDIDPQALQVGQKLKLTPRAETDASP